MITAFDLIQALGSWFFRRGEAIFTGGKDIDTGGGDIVVGTGTVDGVDLTAHVADTDAHHNESHTLASHSGTLSHDTDLTDVSVNDHHNQAHVLATGTALGPDHTISGAADGQVLRASSSTAARFDPLAHADLGSVTANQHHNQAHVLATGTALGSDHTISGAASGQVLRASSSTAARFDPLAHADLGSVTSDQHHNESHTVASHSDTSATGSELNTLTNGSDGSALHDHDGRYFQESEFTSNPGTNSKPLESNSSGNLILPTVQVSARLILAEVSAPGTPASGFGYLWVTTSGALYFKNDAGTSYQLAPHPHA